MATESVCALCGGTGWKIVEKQDVSGAERCECAFTGRSERIEERAQIPPLYRNASLDNFLLPTDNPVARQQLQQIMSTVNTFVRDFPTEKRPGLLLLGNAGTGKTHLAVAALRALIQRGFEGQFCDYQNLLDRIRSGYDVSSNSSDKEAYRSAMEAELLLLDDLGAHRVTDWVLDTVTSIVTYRCNNKKPLIATSNLLDAAAGDVLITRSAIQEKTEYGKTLAEHIGPRARSRLFEMCRVFRMPVIEDYRLRKAPSW